MILKGKRTKDGEIKIEKRFALFPKYIGDTCIWLEYYYVKMIYNRMGTGFFDYWYDAKFSIEPIK